MRKVIIKLCIVIISFFILLPASAYPYGYSDSAKDDPVLAAFKNSLTAVKANDWNKVDTVIKSVETPLANMDKFFGFNLLPELKSAIADKNFKSVVKLLANLMYLSIIEKFEIMVEKGLNDPEYSKLKLSVCKIYYSDVLQRNVKKYDKKKGTSLNKDIVNAFSKLDELYTDPANLSKFKENTDIIKNNLNKAFAYFVFKR